MDLGITKGSIVYEILKIYIDDVEQFTEALVFIKSFERYFSYCDYRKRYLKNIINLKKMKSIFDKGIVDIKSMEAIIVQLPPRFLNTKFFKFLCLKNIPFTKNSPFCRYEKRIFSYLRNDIAIIDCKEDSSNRYKLLLSNNNLPNNLIITHGYKEFRGIKMKKIPFKIKFININVISDSLKFQIRRTETKMIHIKSLKINKIFDKIPSFVNEEDYEKNEVCKKKMDEVTFEIIE